jgi:hypothetical protein
MRGKEGKRSLVRCKAGFLYSIPFYKESKKKEERSVVISLSSMRTLLLGSDSFLQPSDPVTTPHQPIPNARMITYIRLHRFLLQILGTAIPSVVYDYRPDVWEIPAP